LRGWSTQEWLARYAACTGEIMKSRDHLKDLGVWGRRIILKCILNTGCKTVECVLLVQDIVQWWVLVSTVTNIRMPWKAGNFVNRLVTVRFLRRNSLLSFIVSPAIASHKLQTDLLAIQNWLKNGEWKPTNPIRRYSSQYSAHLSAHPNDLIVNLMELPDNSRLRRHLPNGLPTRFVV
jgi:hypothetical protein